MSYVDCNTSKLVSANLIAGLYARVRKGVALLDKRVPNWRRTMRKQVGQYNFMEGDHCVLGTLEHYNGRMQVIRKRTIAKEEQEQGSHDSMSRATKRLRIHGESQKFGFCWGGTGREIEGPILHALWREEFRVDPSTPKPSRQS